MAWPTQWTASGGRHRDRRLAGVLTVDGAHVNDTIADATTSGPDPRVPRDVLGRRRPSTSASATRSTSRAVGDLQHGGWRPRGLQASTLGRRRLARRRDAGHGDHRDRRLRPDDAAHVPHRVVRDRREVLRRRRAVATHAVADRRPDAPGRSATSPPATPAPRQRRLARHEPVPDTGTFTSRVLMRATAPHRVGQPHRRRRRHRVRDALRQHRDARRQLVGATRPSAPAGRSRARAGSTSSTARR